MSQHLVLLECDRCGEQPHLISYAGNVLTSIVCSRCAKNLGPAQGVLLREYLTDFEGRLLHKPGKLVRRAVHEPLRFLLWDLPVGLVLKPAEILKEWREIVASAVRVPPWSSDPKAKRGGG
jgi:hypothetical protein